MLPTVAVMTIIQNLPEAEGALMNFEARQSPGLFEEKQLTSPALPGQRAPVDKLLHTPPRFTVNIMHTWSAMSSSLPRSIHALLVDVAST